MNLKTSLSTSNNRLTTDKIIVILGPTGSGKTSVSVKLAKAIGGEIISADSRAIYKYMDIGTAKPSVLEQDGVPHFGIDLVEPGERFTAYDFKKNAEEKIREIRARGHVPIICGGTGLYIDALIYDYQFPNDGKRSDENSYHHNNSGTETPDRKEVCTNYLLIGVKWASDELKQRLKQRIEQMFCSELYDETRFLVQKYGFGSQAMKSNIYEFVDKYINGELTLEQAKEQSFYSDWHLAKRQLTWFKRNNKINWIELEKIYPYVIKYIQDEQRK